MPETDLPNGLNVRPSVRDQQVWVEIDGEFGNLRIELDQEQAAEFLDQVDWATEYIKQ